MKATGKDVYRLADGRRVPYVTCWSAEKVLPGRIVRHPRRAGIAYPDEVRTDRDIERALWVRQGLGRGGGEPVMAGVHPLRQRQCMADNACQVCGHPAVLDQRGYVFLMRSPSGVPVREGERTVAPPVCAGCVPEAVRDCPPLARGFVAAHVGSYEFWGIAGIIHDPHTLSPLPHDVAEPLPQVAFEDPRFCWTLAARVVVSLRDVTPLSVEDLLSLCADQPPRTASPVDEALAAHPAFNAPLDDPLAGPQAEALLADAIFGPGTAQVIATRSGSSRAADHCSASTPEDIA
ncbi:hypothetical protein ABT160_28470 [Streptomyces sp. NPDC001941]|uniref:hypothetical protein n=1 Tax=Streptomyces sp. NPDC001941 TaxID=3154659 RepID=UPI00331E0633